MTLKNSKQESDEESPNKYTDETELNEKHLSLIYDTLSDLIFLLTVEPDDCFRFVSVNQAFLAVTGLTREQVVGKRIEQVLPESAHALVISKYKEAISENKTVFLEEISAYPTGELMGAVTVTPVWNAQGVCIHLVGSVHDLTELRRVEIEIRDLQRYNRKLIEVSLDPLVTFNHEGCILDVNEATIQATGRSREELIGTPFADYFTDPEKAHKGVMVVFQKGEVRDYELVMKAKDGTQTFVSYNASVYKDQTGDVVGAFASARNITDRKLMENQIKDSLKEKEELLKEIHHRVKSNLQIISSILDLSSMQTTDQDAINIFTDAHTKIHTMALIHSQLYQSTKLDQIDMEKHIRELVGLLSEIYTLRSINTVIECSGVYLSITYAIPCALVLNELISNAYKHAFDNEHKGTIEVSIQKYGDMICMKVKDDGIGIPDNIDIHKTDSLGLKLVRNLIQVQLKGEIQVNRENGTEFIIKCNFLKGDDKNV